MLHGTETTIERIGGGRETHITTQNCLNENTERGRGGNVLAERSKRVIAKLRM